MAMNPFQRDFREWSQVPLPPLEKEYQTVQLHVNYFNDNQMSEIRKDLGEGGVCEKE